MKRTVGALLLPLLCLAAACDDSETPSSCMLPVFTPALQVAVVDSVSGNTLLPGAGGRWIVGTETDSLRYWGNTLAALGPAGRYSVVVEAPGYRAWARSDIFVRAGKCGGESEQVTARMQRE
ncbi:MAG TPA: carboxypeptidase-like regulatory domain-containing protein [Longimicrobium sp.]|nr:carboxypeptidase-like regulatory domain-containing protein [Longimicrobium sp.]